VAQDRRIIEAHHRALNIALREFERLAATRVRRNAANDSRMTGNLVAARFTHETSRPLDPHLHTHVVVFNATFDEQEDRWKALQNYELLRAKKYIENLYYHELAKDLHSLGYSIRNHTRGDFQVEGVPEELCERFSKRHKQIDDALDDPLVNQPGLATANLKDLRAHLASAERSRKMSDISRGHLLHRLEQRMQKMELAFVAAVPEKYHSLVTEGEPLIREIAVIAPRATEQD